MATTYFSFGMADGMFPSAGDTSHRPMTATEAARRIVKGIAIVLILSWSLQSP